MTETIRKKVSTLPHKPGIYLMKDRFGTVIYVGQGARSAQAREPVFPASRRMGWDLKFQRAGRGDPRFRCPRRPQRARGAAARKQAHQGISPALQRQFPRRQTLPDAQGEPERPDPALHAHAASSRMTARAISGRSRTPARCAARWRWCGGSFTCAAAARSRPPSAITSIACTRI